MEVLLKDEIRFKIVIVGDGGVGKSSIVERYLKNTWSENYDPTISVNFDVKTWEEPFFIIK
jgi:small GTP-binding protein